MLVPAALASSCLPKLPKVCVNFGHASASEFGDRLCCHFHGIESQMEKNLIVEGQVDMNMRKVLVPFAHVK